MTGILRRFIPASDKQAFWLSLFLCFFFCLIILFVISPVTGLSKNFGAGNDGYIQLARSLVAGNGYVFEKGGPPVFHRPPIYPLFLIPVAMFPESLQRYIIIIPQSILVGFIGMMIFRIARQLYNHNAAVVSLFLFLINPWVYWNVKNPMTGILQTFLYLVFAYLAAVELINKTNRSQLLSAIFIGISGAALVLTHAAMLPLFFLFLLIIFGIAVKRNKRILTPVCAVLIALCLISPWTYRNWVVFHKFIPVAGGGGLGYFNGLVQWNLAPNCTQRKDESYIDASMRVAGIPGSEAMDTQWKGFKDVNMEEKMNKQVVPHLLKNPGLFIKKVLLNIVGFYFPMLLYHFWANKNFSVELTAITIFHLFLWFFALITIWSAGKQKKMWIPVAAIFFYGVWFLPFTIFIGHWLYTLGTIPFLCILSSRGLIFLLNRSS